MGAIPGVVLLLFTLILSCEVVLTIGFYGVVFTVMGILIGVGIASRIHYLKRILKLKFKTGSKPLTTK